MDTPKWVPLFVLLVGVASVLTCLQPLVAESQLSVICEELGYSEDCNHKDATSKSSEWSAKVGLVTGFIMCAIIGLWTATSDRLGRRLTFLIPALGTLATVLSWMLLYWFDSFYDHWRASTFIGALLNTLSGSYAITLLSVFGQCGDLTASDPQARGWLFMLLEGAVGGSSVVGSQLANLSSVLSMKWLFALLAALVTTLIIYAFFFYPETIDPAVQAKPIDWKRAHVFGALVFCCFTRSARRALDADAMVLYRKRVDLYYGVSLDPDMQLPMDSAELEGSAALLSAQRAATVQEDGESQPPVRAAAATADDSITARMLDGESSTSDSTVASYTEACPPRYVPTRNALPVLNTILGLVVTVVLGYKTVQFNSSKQQFDITGNDYANLLTYSALVRILGTLFIVPVVKPLLRLPLQQLHAMQAAFMVQGLLMGGFCFATHFWHAIVLDCLNSLVSCISYSYIRALITNQTSTMLQGRILGLIAVVEVTTAVAGGAGVSWFFSLTTDAYPAASYVLFGIGFFACAVVPFFIQDPAYDFNHRNIGHFLHTSSDVPAPTSTEDCASLSDNDDPDSLLVAPGGPLDITPMIESGVVFSVAGQHLGDDASSREGVSVEAHSINA